MARSIAKRSNVRPRRPAAKWWVLGLTVLILAGTGAVAYLIYPRTPAGPYDRGVTEIQHIHGLVVDPSNPKVLWIGTHAGLIRVTDGKEWERIGRHTYDMMGFSVHPAGSNLLLTSGHPGPDDERPNPLGVEASRDGGHVWQPVALAGEADFHVMTISRADPQVVYAWNVSGQTGLYRTRDGGRNWDYLGDRGLERVYYLAAHPTKAAVVLAGTMRGLFISEDSGATWRSQNPALYGVPVTTIEVHPKDPRVMFAYAARPGLALIRSEDGGQQWTSVGFFLGDQDAVGNLALDPLNPRVLYFATLGGDLYRSADGGKSRELWVSRGRVVVR